MTDDIGIEALPEEDAPAIELEVEVQDSVSVKDAEAWAVGQRGGVDVVEGDPTYHNNAKYWAQSFESALHKIGLAVVDGQFYIDPVTEI